MSSTKQEARSTKLNRRRTRPKATALPRLRFLGEPMLEFAMGQRLAYPRDGLFLYGPVGDPADLRAIRYGVIGTKAGVARFRRWSASIRTMIDIPAPGLRSREVESQHVPFPGFEQAFHAAWPVDPVSVIDDIDAAEIDRVLKLANRHEAVRGAVDLYVERLVAAADRIEHPPAFWFVVIPEIVYALGRPQSSVPKSERIQGVVSISEGRARQLQREPTLYGDEEEEAEVYRCATHFRRQLKVRLLAKRIVTQIVRETTLTPDEFRRESGMPIRRVEDPATIAWKLCTGAYYKAGGQAVAVGRGPAWRMLCRAGL
ncbi:MAG: hypothetical protein QM688_07010 [Sphingomonas bacterium]